MNRLYHENNKGGKNNMRKRLFTLIMAIIVGGIFYPTQYCQVHHKIDDCWKIEHPNGTNHGDE